MTALIPREPAEIAPGAVHLPGWLPYERQLELVAACREWSRPPAGMRHLTLPGGGRMSVRTVCLGWHWEAYRYTREVGGEPVKAMPGWLADLGRQAVADAYGQHDGQHAYGLDDGHDFDVALVNFYDADAKMGLHQDRDERSRAPVVSLSLGDTGLFRFGNTEGRKRPWTDVELESGDLFVFGGLSRLAFHGVPKIWPGTGPPGLGMRGGRLNLTLRKSGLTGPAPIMAG